MSRIVAFGCSYTFGTGLKDCINDKVDETTTHSKFSYPTLVANKLGYACHNLSCPGYSNYEILLSILNFDFQKTDTVSVMWSFAQRDMVYNIKGNALNIQSPHAELYRKHWALAHTDTDLFLKSWLYFYTAHLHLKDFEHYFFVPNPNAVNFNLRPTYADNIEFENIYIAQLGDQYGLASDNMHPGQQAQNLIAKHLYNKITTKSNQV